MKTGEDGKFLSSQEDRIRWSMFLAAAIKAGSSLRAGVQEADEAMGAYRERCTATAKLPVITDPLKQWPQVLANQQEEAKIAHEIQERLIRDAADWAAKAEARARVSEAEVHRLNAVLGDAENEVDQLRARAKKAAVKVQHLRVELVDARRECAVRLREHGDILQEAVNVLARNVPRDRREPEVRDLLNRAADAGFPSEEP